MEDENDLWNILTDLGDEYQVPDARPDASVVLLSLPLELLQEIAEYCKFSDVHSLATVCKQLHAVAVYRLYTTVALHAAKFLPTTLHSTLDDGDLTADNFLRLCAKSTPSRGGILCGLMARQEHLTALRTLVICDMPTSYSSTYGRHANIVIKDIISRARGLRHISFPAFGYYSADTSASQHGPPLDLKVYQWPASLSSLSIEDLLESTTDMRPLLGQISSLLIKSKTGITGNEALDIGLGPHLRRLDCRWRFHYMADGSTRGLIPIHNFITALSELEYLAIGLEYASEENWSEITTMSTRLLDAYTSIIGELRHLRELEIHSFIPGAHHPRPVFTLEHSSIIRFGNACPSLEWIIFQAPEIYQYIWPNVLWKRCMHPDAEESPIWLPDPLWRTRWKIWFKEYTTAELVQRRMRQFWGEERSTPWLGYLEELAHADSMLERV